MAFGTEMPIVIFAAALTCCFVPTQGIFGTPTRSIAGKGLNQNTNAGTEIATRDFNLPINFDAGCSCEILTHCSCKVAVISNIMGSQFEFHPQIHVEYIENNVSLRVTVKNQDEVLISREFLGESFIPPVCVPIPQFPAIQFCLQVKNLTSSINDKSAGLCLIVGVRAVGVSLPEGLIPPLPLGCFSAALGKELAYIPPEIQIPGFGNTKPLLGDKITVPLNQGPIWPFGGTPSYGEKNKNNDINLASNPLFKFNTW